MPNWFHNAFKTGGQSSFADNSQPTISSYVNAVYYPNWRIYKQQPPSSLNLGFISHVFYAFAWPNEQGTVSLSDEYADTQIAVDGVQGCMAALVQLKQTYPYLRVILSIGGGGQGSTHFPAIARSDASRFRFSNSVKELLNKFGFDGVDIDWEHPSNPQQGVDYVYLLAALRNVLQAPYYTITSALPAGEWALRNINLAAAATYLDFINLMTYDFSGPWVDRAGHQAQLYSPKHPHSDAARLSCGSAVQYVTVAAGVPPAKVLMGVPAYGRSFLGASAPGHAYAGTGGDEGTFLYVDLPRPGATEHVDQTTGAAYCRGGDGGFVTYDNPQTVNWKGLFVRERGLGGLFYWTGTGDAKGKRSLVETGYNTMHNL